EGGRIMMAGGPQGLVRLAGLGGRSLSFSCFGTGAASGFARSFKWMRYVSRALQQVMAETAVMASVSAPIVSGTFAAPGGATRANRAGSRAVIVVPRFCEMAMADTRVRVGKSSG